MQNRTTALLLVVALCSVESGRVDWDKSETLVLGSWMIDDLLGPADP